MPQPPVRPASAPPAPAPILEHHRDNNRASAAGWDAFDRHRQRVTALIAETAGDRLALVGAGNCNDVDLAALAPLYPEIHLIDLDPEALGRARTRQTAPVQAQLTLHAPVDVSGVYAELPRFRGQTLSPAELEALPDRALARARAGLPDGFATVVSACCLSQLMHSLFIALGRHPQLDALATALGRAHLRFLLSLARPGGRVLLLSDVVSTETFPLRELWGTRPPLALLGEIERSGNFLSGTAMTFIRRLLVSDAPAAALAAGPSEVIEPWLWELSEDLAFLVYGLRIRRR